MSKKTDLLFADEEKFLTDNPHFSITKPTPNYAAIRAVLRSGQKIEGVTIVEVAKPARTLGEALHAANKD